VAVRSLQLAVRVADDLVEPRDTTYAIKDVPARSKLQSTKRKFPGPGDGDSLRS
jgi:hypothetical protein